MKEFDRSEKAGRGVGASGTGPSAQFPLTTTFSPSCPHCRQAVAVSVDLAYFAGTKPTCGNCKQGFDWFPVLASLIEDGTAFHQALAPTGAR